MRKFGILKQFARDERGASLLEYTVLLGIITVAAITSITQVGQFVVDKWAAFSTALTNSTPGGGGAGGNP